MQPLDDIRVGGQASGCLKTDNLNIAKSPEYVRDTESAIVGSHAFRENHVDIHCRCSRENVDRRILAACRRSRVHYFDCNLDYRSNIHGYCLVGLDVTHIRYDQCNTVGLHL